jgi:hypothetical protein
LLSLGFTKLDVRTMRSVSNTCQMLHLKRLVAFHGHIFTTVHASK